MICPSCGANSENSDKCDYCGYKFPKVDTSTVLVEADSRKAKILELDEDLRYVYEDSSNTDQVFSRLIEVSRGFLENGDLKKAEFLLKLAAGLKDDDEVIFLTAKVKVWFALNLSGSIQMANIKKKYILDAKKLIEKLDHDSFATEKKELEVLMGKVDGKQASQFTVQGSISSEMSTKDLEEIDKLASSAQSTAKSAAGCGTVIGWIFGGLIILGMIVPYLE